MKLNEIKDPVQEFLKMNRVENYKINPAGEVDVNGSVNLHTVQSKLPVKFGKVDGDFDADSCKLTSLEGAPSYVGGYFSCNHNLLTSLEGAPSHVNGNFYCSDNKLTSLHDVHKIIKEIDGDFYCYGNPIKGHMLGLLMIKGAKGIIIDNDEVQHILNKHLEQGRAGVIDAQQELLDAGLDEYAKL